jgi:glycosyltransferase involved in cell wall biosynthesis
MSPVDFAITFACCNQLDYTRRCLESLQRTGIDLSRVVAVDNGSSDGTRDYLSGLGLGGCILNQGNLGCGVAWNQGILALQAEWTLVMNNDVLATRGWLQGLLDTAREQDLRIASPALVEGPLDYELAAFAEDASRRMGGVLRRGGRHAVCLAVHRSVWQEAGYFRAAPRLFGYEDTLFFDEVRKAGIATAITGASWLHHFGSITQKAMKQERGIPDRQGLGDRNLKRLLHQSWAERKWRKLRMRRLQRTWRATELAQFGMTLHGLRQDGGFCWL